MQGVILGDPRLTILELRNALGLHHHVDKVAAVCTGGEQVLARLCVDLLANVGQIRPLDACHIIHSLANLGQQIGAVCEDHGAVIHRHTIVSAIHDGVGQLFLAEAIPVNVCALNRNKRIRVIGNITLDVVILELHDVGQVGIIVCGTCQRDGVLNVTASRSFTDRRDVSSLSWQRSFCPVPDRGSRCYFSYTGTAKRP